MIHILFLVLCLVTTTIKRVEGIQTTLKEDLELERQLNLINKPPIKSINTKFGYIVDCIDINKQPAFDHPLLRNHKLQRKPSFQFFFENTSMGSSPTKPIFELEKDQCPIGTVPIRRTTKDDLIRAKSFLNSHMLTLASPGSHVAQVTLKTLPNIHYYGVSGMNSIYTPRVENNQSSSSLMWVRNGPIDETNKIVIGWHVAPPLHNNHETYIYSVWTIDNFKKTGCFNLLCPGFVQIDKEIYLGIRVGKTSNYGETSYETRFSLIQDLVTEHWWLYIFDKYIGYFPASLFPNMTSANQVGWGGRTTTSIGTPSPPMGSGHFPDGNMTHACYFRDVKIQDDTRKDYGPEKYMVDTFTDKPNCFDAKYYGDKGRVYSYFLQFGGPGGKCGN